jgi:hypothetical protein
MSKKVELVIEIDEKGKILVTPKGTSGPECLELMAFLDKIEGIEVVDTIPNEDMGKNIKTQSKNKIKNSNQGK